MTTRDGDADRTATYRYGDNSYHRDRTGDWVQENSRHSLDSGEPNLEHVAKDTRADAVLIGEPFTYWGRDAVVLPGELRDFDGVDLARPGRNLQWKPHSPAMITAFATWIDSLPQGCQGEPAAW